MVEHTYLGFETTWALICELLASLPTDYINILMME